MKESDDSDNNDNNKSGDSLDKDNEKSDNNKKEDNIDNCKDNSSDGEKQESKECLNLGEGNNLFLNKRNDAILIEIDKEKSDQKNYDVYQLNLVNDNSNNFGSNLNVNNNEKKILCYRRYKDFDKFYNILKIRFPDCVFPRLSQKNYLKFKLQDDPTFIENRRKELQYFINKLYFHDQIGKSDEFKRFISYAVFEGEYYDNLPKKYSYPECERVKNEKGYFNVGWEKVSGYFSKPKDVKKSEMEIKILNREEEFKNKLIIYNNLLKEIKSIFDTTEEEIKELKIISNNLLFLKDKNSPSYAKKEKGTDKSQFNKLVNLNKEFAEILDNENIEFLSRLIDQLNYCILDVEGVNRAIERYNAFNSEYRKIQDINVKNNRFVLEEKAQIENDKIEFEKNLNDNIKKYDKENNNIYEEIIDKIILYIKTIHEKTDEAFENSNFNN